jgi:Domain of unknown function (DUF1844)
LRTELVRVPGGVGRSGRSVCKGISMDDDPAIPSVPGRPTVPADDAGLTGHALADAGMDSGVDAGMDTGMDTEVGVGLDAGDAMRDIAEVPAIELISTAALHLMSAAAVKCGLGHDEPSAASPGADSHVDLDEARKLITALAGLVTAAAPEVGNQHARLLRDGLRQVQLAFREASVVPDPPGQGPGERLTGPVS